MLKLADMPSCLGGRDNTINERYGLTTQFRSSEFAFWLSALWRFESFSHSNFLALIPLKSVIGFLEKFKRNEKLKLVGLD